MTEETKWTCLAGILTCIAMILLVISTVVHKNTPPEDLSGHVIICGSIIFLAFAVCILQFREREDTMKCKIEMEVDLSAFWPSGADLKDDRALALIDMTIIEAILAPARAHAQMHRRQVLGTAEEEVFEERIAIIDEAMESLVVTPQKGTAFSAWT